MMLNFVYWLPPLLTAVTGPNQSSRLKAAVLVIERAGRKPDLAVGYAQWQAFLGLVRAYAENEATDLSSEEYGRLLDLLVGRIKIPGGLPALMENEPIWEDAVDSLLGELTEHISSRPAASLHLARNGATVLRVPIGPQGSSGLAVDALPGQYALSSDSGLLLWCGELKEDQLISNTMDSGTMPLAAATSDCHDPLQESWAIQILDGRVTLRLFPVPLRGQILLQVAGEEGGGQVR